MKGSVSDAQRSNAKPRTRYGNVSGSGAKGSARSVAGGCRRGDRERRAAAFPRGSIQAAHEGAA